MSSASWGIRWIVCEILLLGLVFAAIHAHAKELKWYRGQLHAHSYWSDGHAFPDQAIDAYKQRGYDFMCLSEHNRFPDDPNHWRVVAAEEGDWPPEVTQEMFDAYLKSFGPDWVESKTEGSVTSVRLKTYSELKGRFDEEGKFLLLPGVELTQTLRETSVHQNYLNLPLVLPIIQGTDLVQELEDQRTVAELLRLDASQVVQAAKERKAPYILSLNHPFWRYCDIVPQNLIDCPEIRFFEVCNGGSDYPPHPDATSYTVEKLWDVVNAFRRLRGQALLYGIGTDDAHYYDAKRIDGVSGVGDAWVMVRADELAPDAIIAAMHYGNFYATCGVILRDVTFDRTQNVLRVAVKAAPGQKYRISFITTKRGFDPAFTEVASPAEGDRAARTIPVYSDEIGRVVRTVDGIEAEYRMEPDDLYVRARIESDAPTKYIAHFHPTVQTAWTQPYSIE